MNRSSLLTFLCAFRRIRAISPLYHSLQIKRVCGVQIFLFRGDILAAQPCYTADIRAEFSPAFYKPYEAAVETAFLTLCAARTQFELDTPYAVRSMTFRLKSPASLQDKLVRRGLTQDASGAAMLNDIAGLRVVLSSIQAVYRFAELLKKMDNWQFVLARDYIACPKASGYRSLHLVMHVPVCVERQRAVVPVEIQLRTPAMDMWACVEHDLCYKPVKEA